MYSAPSPHASQDPEEKSETTNDPLHLTLSESAEPLHLTRETTWRATPIHSDAGKLLIEGRIYGPVDEFRNAVVARCKFVTKLGEEIAHKPLGWSESKAAGCYVYISKHQLDGHFHLALDVPAGCRPLFSFQIWTRSAPQEFSITISRVEFTPEKTAPAEHNHPIEQGARRVLQSLSEALLRSENSPLYENEYPVAEAAVEAYVRSAQDSRRARALGIRRLKAGRSTAAANLAAIAKSNILGREAGRLKLLEYARNGARKNRPSHRINTCGMLYLLHNCRPFDSGGYATRAQGLLTGFVQSGWNVQAIARLGYPWDRKKALSDVPSKVQSGEVEYSFLPNHGSIDQVDQIGYIEAYANAVLEAVDPQHVGVVVAASFHHNALAGRIIADRLKVPLVYEMRGLHWFTNGSKDPQWQKSEQGALFRDIEIEAAKNADFVFTITDALKKWLFSFGVRAPIHTLPNGCFRDELGAAQPRGFERSSLGVPETAFTLGYIGSFMYYEGIDNVMRATAIARDISGEDIRFLVAGSGANGSELMQLYQEMGEPDFIHFVGRVPPEQVPDVYAAVDVVCLARKNLEVCNIISPLKPLEAMLMGKPIIASDVAAMAEIVEPSGAGLSFRADDLHALVRAILALQRQPDQRVRMGQEGRWWALQNRTWQKIAEDGGLKMLDCLS